MNDEKTKAAVERLRMRTQLYAQTKTRIMPGTTSTIETLLVAEVRVKDVNLVLAALDAANERAERAEGALRELAGNPEQFCGSSTADHVQLFCECEGLRSFAANALMEAQTND